MNEQTLDPRTPIPNDDPRCHCALEPGGNVADDVVVMSFGNGDGGLGRVAMHLDCPHHGSFVRDVQQAAAGSFSIGRP
jgi:hypothetical protein